MASSSFRPTQPPAVREPLASLCAFLEQRLTSANFALLRRMAAEFEAGGEQTLLEFVELGVNLVAVLPADAPDPSSRAAAAQLLQRQRLRGASRPPDDKCVLAFLEKRVGTKNLAWLRRIYDEFLEGREDMLRAFVRYGEEAISVFPVFLAPASESPHLVPYPAQPRYVAPPPPPPPPQAFAVFPQQALPLQLLYPPPPVVLQQVRAGYSNAPLRFESGAPAPSTNDPPATRPSQPAPPQEPEPEPVQSPPSPPKPQQQPQALRKSTRKRALDSPEDAESAPAKPLGDTKPPAPKTRGRGAPAPAEAATPQVLKKRVREEPEALDATQRVKRAADATPRAAAAAAAALGKAKVPSSDGFERVRAEFKRIEASEPWKDVFHAQLVLPLEHPRLTLALQRFFVLHGRALWERKFWLPLPGEAESEQNAEWVKRQQIAKSIFLRRVISLTHKLLGATFFVELDGRDAPHEGWWYRQPVVSLHAVCYVKGVDFCLQYLREQSRERFPDSGMKRSKKGARGHHTFSKSMWSSDRSVDLILQDIKELKSGGAGAKDGTDSSSGTDSSRGAAGAGKEGAVQEEADSDAYESDDNDARSGESDAEL